MANRRIDMDLTHVLGLLDPPAQHTSPAELREPAPDEHRRAQEICDATFSSHDETPPMPARD